jgi:hypothetical protein
MAKPWPVLASALNRQLDIFALKVIRVYAFDFEDANWRNSNVVINHERGKLLTIDENDFGGDDVRKSKHEGSFVITLTSF